MKREKKKIMIKNILLPIFLLINYSCNTIEPPPPTQEQPKAVELRLIEATCTEAFINVAAEDTLLPVIITLNRDESFIINFTLTKPDTIIIDETLLPGKTYVYQTRSIINGNEEIGDTLQVRTLDTTSHNFTWQTFTFGEPETAGSSTMNDVSVIDQNNIYAVGEIFVNDSTGQPDPNAYNSIQWNGIDWKYKRISVIHNGNLITSPLYGIYEFSLNDIWLSSGVPIHGDGNNWTQFHLFDMGVLDQNDGYLTKIWGLSSLNLYYVGTLGTIAYSQNGTWQKIESGITSDLLNIWGTKEIMNGSLKILVTASSINDYKILSINGSSAKDTLEWPASRSLSGIWLDGRRTYASGADIWINEKDNWRQATSTGYFFTTVRGTKCNNIYGIGPDGIVHFNGSSWQIVKQRPEGIVLIAGDCNDNIVAAVGFTSSGGVVGKAAVLLGTLNK